MVGVPGQPADLKKFRADRNVAAVDADIVAALNRCLENIPRQQVRLHVCWGNYEGPHDCDVPLEDILPILLQADVGALVLPFANPRHAHEYKVLQRLPLARLPFVPPT